MILGQNPLQRHRSNEEKHPSQCTYQPKGPPPNPASVCYRESDPKPDLAGGRVEIPFPTDPPPNPFNI
ncbi:hypothetical protein DSO57_1018740 [Entomophthora muscae]|uniref:Uncharacterized protein n=1 Tax=Entomophthora muscae TaxID=34485 RepID=A0ACC2S6C0_9FUNG|nr:hypothetical protein DSO57_1018740 [Entomophthora muscae]